TFYKKRGSHCAVTGQQAGFAERSRLRDEDADIFHQSRRKESIWFSARGARTRKIAAQKTDRAPKERLNFKDFRLAKGRQSHLHGFVNFDVTSPVGDFGMDTGFSAPKDQIHTGAAAPKIFNAEFIEGRRQSRAIE